MNPPELSLSEVLPPPADRTTVSVPLSPDSARRYPPITIKIASSRAEREGAFRLVYQRYLGSGLCADNPHSMRVTPYHLLPTTSVFVAIYQGEVIFTHSLIQDGELGVPMEYAFPDEIRGLRERGIRFGEVSCMADRRRNIARFLPLFVRVTRLMFQFARYHGNERIVIAVHPKHGRFYERFFGFRQMGEERPYQTVQNNPAVAYSLEWCWLPPLRHDQFFGVPIPPEELQPQPLSEEELAAFRRAAIPLGASELLSDGYEISPQECESGPELPDPGSA